MSQQASIFNQSGVAPTSFAGVQQPWHRVFTKLSDAETKDFDAALVAGDIAWDLKKAPFLNPYNGEPTPVYGIFRDDNNAFLGNARAGYEPISNRRALNFLRDIIGEDKNITIDSCGSFAGGSKVFANLHVGTFEVVPGDVIEVYHQFVTSHDGSMPLSVFMSYTRMVCSNTVRHAMAQAQTQLKIRHSQNSVAKMENVAEWLQLAAQEQENFNNKLKFLATKKTTADFENLFLDTLLGKDEPKLKKSGDVKETRRLKLRNMILAADGANGVVGVEGTVYGLLNKVTSVYDHALVNNAHAKNGLSKSAAHAISASFGSMSSVKTRAFDILVEAAKTL